MRISDWSSDVCSSDLLIEKAEQQLYQLAETGQTEGGPRPLSESLAVAITMAEAAYKRDSHVTGVTTGLIDIDRRLGGLHPSDLLILAGRPSMGKTALATNIALNRSEERSGGHERVRKCRYRWSPYHKNKKRQKE